jgi:hypothetical protein
MRSRADCNFHYVNTEVDRRGSLFAERFGNQESQKLDFTGIDLGKEESRNIRDSCFFHTKAAEVGKRVTS